MVLNLPLERNDRKGIPRVGKMEDTKCCEMTGGGRELVGAQ